MKRWWRELLCQLFGCDAELKSWKATLALSRREVVCFYMECKRCDRRWSLDD